MCWTANKNFYIFCIYYLRISTFSLYQHSAVTKIWTAILRLVVSLWLTKTYIQVTVWLPRIFFLGYLYGNENEETESPVL